MILWFSGRIINSIIWTCPGVICGVPEPPLNLSSSACTVAGALWEKGSGVNERLYTIFKIVYFMCMGVFPTYLSVHHMCVWCPKK